MLLNPYRFAVAAPSALLTGLVSYWKLDEASGNALDVHGANQLTQVNSPGSAAGKIGGARDFVAASSKYFHKTPAGAGLTTGDIDFTFSMWVLATSFVSAQPSIISKWLDAGPSYEFLFFYEKGPNRFNFIVIGITAAVAQLRAENFGAASTGVWYHLLVWHDSVNNELGIAVNNGTPNTMAWTTGVTGQSMPFWLGSKDSTTGYWDGLIDEVGFWKRILTPAERAELYNSGNGLAYPFTPPPPITLLTGLISYWKLDEASGNAIDSHGTNHLIDWNGTGSGVGKIGTARDFEASSGQVLQIETSPDLRIGDIEFTYTVWVQGESFDNGSIITKWSPGGGFEFLLYYATPDNRFVAVSAQGGVDLSQKVLANALGAPSVGVWYFIVTWHDPVTHKLYIQVNNGPVNEATVIPPTSGYNVFTIGAPVNSPYFRFDGLIDEVGFWKRILTPAERTELYNSGNGKTYPFT